MLVSDFDFHLPDELIAQEPPAERGTSRMLELDRRTGVWRDGAFSDLPNLLHPGDVLVLNNSRVIPARLFARRHGIANHASQPPSGRIEVLLTEQESAWEWKALVKPGKKVPLGEHLTFFENETASAPLLEADVMDRGEFGDRLLRFTPVEDFYARLDRLGHMPLPPYIHRADNAADTDRYQTVYAAERGSVAAPTAGLHFTPEVLSRIAERGVQICHITLHVGLGTFQPIRVAALADIHLHTERFTLPPDTASAINAARSEGRRIVAAGTTTVRTLEHCASVTPDAVLHPHSGSTNIFIAPGYRFRIVDALLTNFHLPKSTLLMLVSAFAGREPVLAAYLHAVYAKYRFFSYGDCMFIA